MATTNVTLEWVSRAGNLLTDTQKIALEFDKIEKAAARAGASGRAGGRKVKEGLDEASGGAGRLFQQLQGISQLLGVGLGIGSLVQGVRALAAEQQRLAGVAGGAARTLTETLGGTGELGLAAQYEASLRGQRSVLTFEERVGVLGDVRGVLPSGSDLSASGAMEMSRILSEQVGTIFKNDAATRSAVNQLAARIYGFGGGEFTMQEAADLALKAQQGVGAGQFGENLRALEQSAGFVQGPGDRRSLVTSMLGFSTSAVLARQSPEMAQQALRRLEGQVLDQEELKGADGGGVKVDKFPYLAGLYRQDKSLALEALLYDPSVPEGELRALMGDEQYLGFVRARGGARGRREDLRGMGANYAARQAQDARLALGDVSDSEEAAARALEADLAQGDEAVRLDARRTEVGAGLRRLGVPRPLAQVFTSSMGLVEAVGANQGAVYSQGAEQLVRIVGEEGVAVQGVP